MILRALYKALLKSPNFPGRHRLDSAMRTLLAPPLDRVDGLRMELDPQEWLQIEMMSGRLLEPKTIDLIKRLLQPGDTFIDVGAHVGLHTLEAARCVGPEGVVIAVDPQPYNCERLLNNVLANDFTQVIVVAAAAGPEDGAVVLRQQSRSDKSRLTLADNGVNDRTACFEIPVVRLDTLAARHAVDQVRLLKIDVEGFEASVLAGASLLLSRTQNVVFECLEETANASRLAVSDILLSQGFRLQHIDGSPWRSGEPMIEFERVGGAAGLGGRCYTLSFPNEPQRPCSGFVVR